MAYNPIAPTSSRENRKPPTNVPLSTYLAADPATGIIGFSDDPDEAAFMFAENVEGIVGIDTYDATQQSRIARVGEQVLPITIPMES